MPKQVDHEAKKRRIIEFAYESILKNGAKGASVRSIAEIAEMTPGQIRYYYSNHTILLQDVMRFVTERVTNKIQMIFEDDSLPIEERIIKAILEVIPLDAKRTADMQVWLSFQNELHEVGADTMSEDIYLLVDKCYNILANLDLLNTHIEKSYAITKMHALMDGLALHKLYAPQRTTNEMIENILIEELKTWMR
ncbi:TetR/AcrR family transcriptional regulator [Macrococcus animalis]|uniref:TetR/AcrR family transcriptional regulator n=1 Tax=Macrococcus animalis TaxID=3395467 RepID=UPI0039BEA547